MMGFGIVALVVLMLGGYAAHAVYSDGYEDAEEKHVQAAAKELRESKAELAALHADERTARESAEARAVAIEKESAVAVADAEQRAADSIAAARAAADKHATATIAAALAEPEPEGQLCPALCVLPGSSQ